MELQALIFHLRFMLDNMEFSTLKDERKIGAIRSTPSRQFYISRLSFLEHLPNFVQKSFEKVTSFIIDMALLLSDFIFISYYFM